MNSSLQKITIGLKNERYVPVKQEDRFHYGGSQMWFQASKKFSKDYILHNYGCGTIATADLFLYLTSQNELSKSPETKPAYDNDGNIAAENYYNFVHYINQKYTKTKIGIAVLGPLIAKAINLFSKTNHLNYKAEWKWHLTGGKMLAAMKEMLLNDIPVIFSIGPNTPNLWGKKGITFYQKNSETSSEISGESSDLYIPSNNRNVNGHYVTVTGIFTDDITGSVMLRISSWGKQYFINYNEYRDYVNKFGGTFTSSLVFIKKIDYS